MAEVRLSDVVIPELYQDYAAVDSPELTAFFQSGAAVRNPLMDQIAAGSGRITHIPFWNDLDGSDEPNYSSDDPSSNATPGNIDAAEQIARRAFVNQGYSAMDLAGEIAGSDPMQRIRNRFGTYWMKAWQRRVLATLSGVQADNVANDNGDMVNNIAGATNGDVTSSTLFSRDAFTTAAFTSGDHYDDYQAIAVHSVVYKRMIDNDDITFIRPSEGSLEIPTFMGRRVIVDDGVTFTPAAGTGSGDAAAQYTSILFGAGAVAYGEATPRVPVEIEREASAGDGGGQETIWERRNWIVHPFGFSFSSTTVTGQSPNLANLRLATNWDRVVDRKNVPLAFLVTNG